MRNLIKIGVVLLAAAVLGSCFLFGGVSIDPADVNRAMSIASHEAVYNEYFGPGNMMGSQTGSGGPLAYTFPGTTSGTAEWSPTDVSGTATGNITFTDFAVTSEDGDEYVINGTVSLATTYDTNFTAAFDGDLTISVNGEIAVDVTLDVTYSFSVSGSNPFTLSVTTSGEVNGEVVSGGFNVTFTR